MKKWGNEFECFSMSKFVPEAKETPLVAFGEGK